MNESTKNQCAHTGCSCMAAADGRYCSPHCETVKTRPEISCECGHPECAGKAE